MDRSFSRRELAASYNCDNYACFPHNWLALVVFNVQGHRFRLPGCNGITHILKLENDSGTREDDGVAIEVGN